MHHMIHKLSFLRAKDGLGQPAFTAYWRDVHAERFIRPLPGLRGYRTNVGLSFGTELEEPVFHGVAESWLDDAEADIALVRSSEYLDGVRQDELNFLTWWATLNLNTHDHEVIAPPTGTWLGLRVFGLMKRRPGMLLDEFRQYSREVHAPKVVQLPGVSAYVQAVVDDGHYAVAEAPIDAVSMLWFEDVEGVRAAMESAEFADLVIPDYKQFIDLRYFRTLVTDSQWLIQPGA
jgi:uncharacterized protein (TIGR02118 family)